MNEYVYLLIFLFFLAVAVTLSLYFTGFFTPAIDCVMSQFTECDPITGIRTRTVIKHNQGDGKLCGSLTENCKVDCAMGPWGSCDINGTQSRAITIAEKNGGIACGPVSQECVIDISGQWNVHDGGHEGIVEILQNDNTSWRVRKVSGGDIRDKHIITYKHGTGYIYNETVLKFTDNSLKRLVNNQNIGVWMWR